MEQILCICVCDKIYIYTHWIILRSCQNTVLTILHKSTHNSKIRDIILKNEKERNAKCRVDSKKGKEFIPNKCIFYACYILS